MADPDQPTSLNQAITPVGTCEGMCPEFESIERIVQKMVDKCEKVYILVFLPGQTLTLLVSIFTRRPTPSRIWNGKCSSVSEDLQLVTMNSFLPTFELPRLFFRLLTI
jgi:hypothetical protein